MRRKSSLFFFGLIILIFLYVLLEFYQIHITIERFFYDIRDWWKTTEYQEKIEAKEIVIVDVDDRSLKEFGRFQRWPRYLFGMAINEVAGQGPSVIGVDFIFSEPEAFGGYGKTILMKHLSIELSSILTNFDSSEIMSLVDTTLSLFSFDPYVSSSIKKASNVVLASYLTSDSADLPAEGYEVHLLEFPPPKSAPRFEGMVTPISQFLEDDAWLGIINSIQDEDGVQRKAPIFFNYKDKTVPSFAFTVAVKVARVWSFRGRRLMIGGRNIWLDKNNFLWLNYQGDFKTFEYVSFVDLIKGNIQDNIFKNRIVLFGSSSPGIADLSQVPFGRQLPSIEVHANIIHNLLYSRPIKKASKLYSIIFAFIVVFLVLWLSYKLPPYVSPVIVVILIGGYFLFVLVQYITYLVDYEMTRPMLAIVLSFVAGLTFRINLLEKEKRHIRDLFSRYVPEEVIKEIIRAPHFSLQGERREISVLISDIRGFTSRAEHEVPENVVEELNAYFEEMSEVTFQHGGMIDKFMGDGILCLFGAPIFHPAHADRALSCAVAMQQRLHQINQEKIKEKNLPIHAGIAINSGEVIIGNIGSSYRAEYTAIGDTVNTAARLEPLNKEYITEILITEATRNRLKGNYKIESVGKVLLKGKSEPTTIYAVSPY